MRHERGIDLIGGTIDGFTVEQLLAAGVAVQKMTLADIPEWYAFFAWCPRCRRKEMIRRYDLQRGTGPDVRFKDVERRLRCMGCGVKGQSQLRLGKVLR